MSDILETSKRYQWTLKSVVMQNYPHSSAFTHFPASIYSIFVCIVVANCDTAQKEPAVSEIKGSCLAAQLVQVF